MSYFPLKIEIEENGKIVEKIIQYNEIPIGKSFKVLETNVGNDTTKFVPENVMRTNFDCWKVNDTTYIFKNENDEVFVLDLISRTFRRNGFNTKCVLSSIYQYRGILTLRHFGSQFYMI